MTDNIMTINQVNAMQELLQMQRKPIRAPSLTDSLTRQLPCNQTVIFIGSQTDQHFGLPPQQTEPTLWFPSST